MSNASLFVSSGFSALQKEIDRVLIELATPKTPNSTSYNIQTYAKLLPGYSASLINLGSIIGYVVACLSVCGSIPLFSTLLCHLVSENKAKVREFLFILGLKKSVYWLSWTITALVPGLIYVIICLVLNYVVKTFVG